jgi:hypothetical protein
MENRKEDENLVKLNDWKKRKDEQQKQEARAKAKQQVRANNGGSPINMNSPVAQRLVLLLFAGLIIWLAMPAGYLDTLLAAITGR